jgi:hypothetical protein
MMGKCRLSIKPRKLISDSWQTNHNLVFKTSHASMALRSISFLSSWVRPRSATPWHCRRHTTLWWHHKGRGLPNLYVTPTFTFIYVNPWPPCPPNHNYTRRIKWHWKLTRHTTAATQEITAVSVLVGRETHTLKWGTGSLNFRSSLKPGTRETSTKLDMISI